MRVNQRHSCRLTFALLATVILNFSHQADAGEKEDNVIDNAIAAYGGDKLIHLPSLTIRDRLTHFTRGQTGHSLQGDMSAQLNQITLEIHLDLENKNKVFKRTTTRLVGNHGSHNLVTTHRIFADGQGVILDHCLQQYERVGFINFDNIDAGFSQTLDTIIIRQLHRDRQHSQWNGTAYIQGQAHDVLTVNADSKNEYSLYINRKSGYLSRMLTTDMQRTYDFLQHQQLDGITWSKEMFVSSGDTPVYYTQDRQISLTAADAKQFTIAPDYKAATQPEYYDVSQFSIREVAEGVYFVGQEWSYTLFIDVGEYYISAGAWGQERTFQGWKKALNLLRETTGNNKPVKQHLVSHHHTDHMAGLSDIIKLGADLIIHPDDIPAVNAYLQHPLDAARFIPISSNSNLADGKVVLFDVPNSHANHNLVIYLPEYRLLFSEDMFGSSFKTEMHSPNSWPSLDTYERLNILVDKVNEMDLEVEQYLSSHHGRVLNQKDIDKALTMGCPDGDAITKKLFSPQHRSFSELD